LTDTPRRFADWWKEFIEYEPGNMDTTFESTATGQIVTVSGMRVWSLCEHHLLPFWCDVSIGYIPASRTLGLSKFARIAHHCAHRLQVQERLVEQIAQMVQAETNSPDIGVIASGQHLCMMMRGIRSPGMMTTYTGLGQFNTDPTRQFFMQLNGR
jgi:GTP cyclohydrolase IA